MIHTLPLSWVTANDETLRVLVGCAELVPKNVKRKRKVLSEFHWGIYDQT